MFLDILEFTVEKQKNCLAKTVLKMWSQKLTKNGLKVHKTTFRKSAKTKKSKNKKQWKRLKSLADSGDKTSSSGRFLRPDFQYSFS